MRRTPTPRRTAAFTLIELVLAMALSAVVLLALQSVVLIAAKAVPGANKTPDASDVSLGFARLAGELSYAKAITKNTATRIDFTVADRDGDAADDTISYQWSGVSGAPLLRQFNAAAPQTVVPDVRALALSLKNKTVTQPQTYTDSAEVTLAEWTGANSTGTEELTSSNWMSQFVQVTLPAGASSYSVSRVRLMLRTNGTTDGVALVKIVSQRTGLPGNTVLDSTTVLESSLGSVYNWHSIPFTNVVGLQPTERFCIVAEFVANGKPFDWHYVGSGFPASAGYYIKSTDAGASWSANTGRCFRYQVLGTYSTPSAPVTTTVAAFLRAQLKAGSSTALELNLPLPSAPVVLP